MCVIYCTSINSHFSSETLHMLVSLKTNEKSQLTRVLFFLNVSKATEVIFIIAVH